MFENKLKQIIATNIHIFYRYFVIIILTKFFNRFNNIILCELFIYVRKYITLHIKRGLLTCLSSPKVYSIREIRIVSKETEMSATGVFK